MNGHTGPSDYSFLLVSSPLQHVALLFGSGDSKHETWTFSCNPSILVVFEIKCCDRIEQGCCAANLLYSMFASELIQAQLKFCKKKLQHSYGNVFALHVSPSLTTSK